MTIQAGQPVLASDFPAALTLVPKPNYPHGAIAARALSSNTTLWISQVVISIRTVANKISFRCDGVSVAGTVKIALFSADGQTQIFSITTATISASGMVSTALSAVDIPQGIYWLAVLSVSTTNITATGYSSANGYDSSPIIEDVSGKAVIAGILTVTASTMPATITPTSVSYPGDDVYCLLARLDA